MKKVNYHTHTKLCRHAGGTEEDCVNAALAAHLDVLGFSDHAPYPDDRLDNRMRYEELEGHLSAVASLRDQYQDRLTILTGLEIEYFPEMHDYYQKLREKLDYLLLGQHYFPAPYPDGERITVYDTRVQRDDLLHYAKSIEEALATGFFPVLAHPDVIFINDIAWDEACEKASDIIIGAAKRYGVLLEVNANGLRRGLRSYSDGERYPYPHPAFWKRAAAAGVTAIVGSDCHNPLSVWDDAIEQTYAMAKTWGLKLADSFPLYR